MKYQYRLTEEVARWTFEVQMQRNPHWDVVFTNPTAGPWKRLQALSKKGKRGEVYRFDRDEARPDVVMVNDNLSAILIIEAKDSIARLRSPSQVRKSCQVVVDMASILSGIQGDHYWQDRWRYTCFNALLWGSTEESDRSIIQETLNSYKKQLLLTKSQVDASVMLGIETRKVSDDLEVHFHGLSASDVEKRILGSLTTK